MRTKAIRGLALAGAAWFASSPVPAAATPRDGPVLVVTSAGIADVTPAGGSPIAMVHVRVSLSNPDPDLPWRFDARTTRIDLGPDGLTRPVLVNADVATLPVVVLEPGARVVVDLFAVIPARLTTVDELSVWARVASPDRRFEVVADYTREALPDALVARFAPVGHAASWWAQPRFPWATFERRSGPIVPRPPAAAVVVLRER